jgi:DNA (cytosine-5)-methyltransferase 1
MANEFVPEAARTYKTNFPDCVVDRRDIREIKATDEMVADFLAGAKLKRRQLDILDGSPPCCEFSTAGRGIGDQDVLRPYSDDYETRIDVSEAMILVAMGGNLLRRNTHP